MFVFQDSNSKVAIVIPIMFLVMTAFGAYLILFPGPQATLETIPGTDDLAGTAFSFYGVTEDGESIPINDMETFSILPADVYVGTTKIVNAYVSTVASWQTTGFVYQDTERPLTLTARIGVWDWTAYSLSVIGGGSDKYTWHPFTLYGFALEERETDPVGTPWVNVFSPAISPTTPMDTDNVVVTARYDFGIDYGSETASYELDESIRTKSATGMSGTLRYTIDGVSTTVGMSIVTERLQATIPAQTGGKVVSWRVTGDYMGATDAVTGSYTVGTTTIPDDPIYYTNQYAGEEDRLNYAEMTYETSWDYTTTEASATDVNLGRVYFVDPGDGSPFMIPTSIATTMQGWFEHAWYGIWGEEYNMADMPDDAILRVFLRAYVDIEGYTGPVSTEIIQSEGSSTPAINFAISSGTTMNGDNIIPATAFGGVAAENMTLAWIILIVGIIGFVVTGVVLPLRQTAGGWL